MRNCLYLLLILTVVLLNTGLLQAQSNDPAQEARMQQLEKVCRDQEQKIHQLQKRLGVLESEESYKEYTQNIVREYLKEEPMADEETGIVAGYDKGFFVRSADGNYEMKITGFVQMGAAIFENDSYDNNGFFPYGVYLAFDFYMLKDFHARVQVDFADGGDGVGYRGTAGVTIKDAYIEYLPIKEANLRVGNMHVPFTIAGQYDPDGGVTIWSEPFIRSWGHGRDPGIMIHGLIADMVGYQISVHNGEGSATLNADDDFLMAAALRFYFLGHEKNENSFFHVGVIRSRDANIHDSNNPNSAVLYSPWGRQVFDGNDNNPHNAQFGGTGAEQDVTWGWKTGVDTGIRFDMDFENGSNLYVESEFMYIYWERDLPTGRLPFVQGFGVSFGITYRHCFNPEVPGSGLFPSFAFSYSDIDNKDTDSRVLNANIRGQRIWNYTVGLGYAFNKHFSINFNYVLMNLDNPNVNGPKSERDGSDDWEHAWFLAVLAKW